MTRRAALTIIGTSAAIVAGVATIAVSGGYRLNLTPSEPLGLWRIEALHRSVEIGDLVFVCPPVTVEFEQARQRGYLRSGLCAGSFAPLIKTVAGLPGQRVDIAGTVVVDSRLIPSSDVRATDGEGRSIRPFAGGVVPPGHLFLHSPFASSYDSRYFGPIPGDGLLGLARPVLTFGP